MKAIGLIAGNGRLPLLLADAARAKGLRVVAVGHRGETDPALEAKADAFAWVGLGQLDKIVRTLKDGGAERAMMAGGIGRVRALTSVRPDLGALKVIASLRGFRDDGLLRTIARYFEQAGIAIVSPTELLPQLLAPDGHLAGPPPDAGVEKDLALGLEAARALGRADVGQTVVVRNGHVLAVEAIEGTDECIRRGGKLGGAGATVVKLAKPGQDERFDLPAVGPRTLEVMAEVGARALALEAGRTLLLDAGELFAQAARRGISVVGVR